MAKRVFELARELNLTAKELLAKIKDVDVDLKSHMSTLDDAMEAQVRKHLFGKKSEAAVEETRIRPTVIRRRRKTAPESSVLNEADAEQEDTDIMEPSEEEAPVRTSQEALPEITNEASPFEAHRVPETAPPETPAEQPAVVIEMGTPATVPLEIQGEPIIAETTPAATEETVMEQAAQADDSESFEPEATAPQAEEAVTAPEEASESTVEKASVEVSTVEELTDKTISPVPAKTKKNKKKLSKELPARIIELPKAPLPKPAEEQKAVPMPTEDKGRFQPVPVKAIPTPEEEADAAEKKKGKRGKKPPEEPVKDKKFFKKKIAFRRKEVVEGAALYTGEMRNRKARKGAKGAKPAPLQKPLITVAKQIKRRVKIDDTIVLSELAKRMGIKAADMIRTLMGLGVMATVNQTIDFETAVLVAGEFDYEVERAAFEEDTFIKAQADAPENMMERPPVVTIMGHVDHGKTSLLDVIRKTKITATEAGGITQHIGAYHVTTEKGQIVFLDTPGHEAFTAMRARGAKVTDIVVLVVAADDGVMPQTVEAINHARASNVPIVVAINKIDKANADMDRVVRQLSEIGIAPEEWGGDTIFVRVSAKQNQGIDDLLDMLLLQSEMLELRANPNRLASGHVVESKLDSGRGPVATVLVQGGTLHTGDSVVCGVHYGKIRAMLNDLGQPVVSAGPSMPVEIIGLSGVPLAGDEMVALESEKDAKQVSLHRVQKLRSQELAKNSRMSLEGLFEKMKTGEVKDLNLIIKADVDGSIEALRDSLVKLSNEEVKINVVHAATGTITESDVSLAAVSNAIIIGFNVRPNTKVSDMAQEEHVDVRLHNVIYDVIQEVKNAIVGMMASTFEERLLGKAEVREVFHVPKIGTIAGCSVTDGKIERNQQARLIRDGVIRYEGKISSLRRYKDDVKEVTIGYECGIGISNFNDIKLGDIIECFYMEEIKPEID
ncbi:MAG: translation initiation factor IF-2 [Desulfobacterales bacterium]|jgi:translation initiation factor IF-2|nr:translation initiation factor IF-2 [Desulfobacterales bacterium]